MDELNSLAEGRADALLSWFLRADLRSADGTAGLLDFLDEVRPSKQRIRDVLRLYEDVQDRLREAAQEFAWSLSEPRSGPSMRRYRERNARDNLQEYLDGGVQLVLVESPRGRRPPMRIENRPRSRLGWLALKLLDRMGRAKSAVTCPYCGSVELFPDQYRHVTCGRDRCIAAYRREWKRLNAKRGKRKGGRSGKTRTR